MRKGQKRGISLLLAWVMLLSLSTAALAAEQGAQDALEQTAEYIYREVPAPQVGSIGGEWAVIGLARSGRDVPQAYWDAYYERVERDVAACRGVLHERKYTEYARVVLALTAIGADPKNVAGYDLLTPLGDYDKTVWQGINGPVWALIALDSGKYEMPQNGAAKTQATRALYVDAILAAQLPDGGWSLSGAGSADADVTAMALQALAPYRAQKNAGAAVERGLTCLSHMQAVDGGFVSGGAANAESAAQVTIALCTLGIDLEDARFVKNGHTVLESLLGYQQADGGFRHTGGGNGSAGMAAEQALCALGAVRRSAAGQSPLYRMDDVTIHPTVQPGQGGLSGKHPDVRPAAVTAPGTTFSDLAEHEARQAVEALAARGILNGKDGGCFDPDATMTRAEFCAAVVRSLGLTPRESGGFSDVPAGRWYAPYVGTAHGYGIVKGVDGGKFAPGGTITRQEAAVMVARAARLCGLDTARNGEQTRNILAQFADYRTAASWAAPSLAFCYDAGLMDQSDLEIAPNRAILRGEIAEMLYQMLGQARLL